MRMQRLLGLAALMVIGLGGPASALRAAGFYTAPANPVYNLGPESA